MQSANVLGYTTSAGSAGGTSQPASKSESPVENINGSSQRSFAQPLIVDETKQYMEGLVTDDHDDDEDSHSKNENQTNANTIKKGTKKTRGRVKIKMEFIQNKLRRYTTFSKRKTGIMKKVASLLPF